jgi:hypothetical protein
MKRAQLLKHGTRADLEEMRTPPVAWLVPDTILKELLDCSPRLRY